MIMEVEDAYAKLAKAREKKLKARQEQDEEKKRKNIARMGTWSKLG